MAYIPKNHEKYNLLPLCRKDGGEVFSYPVQELSEVEEILFDSENLIPYGYNSYDEYYNFLDALILKHGTEDECINDIGKRILKLKKLIFSMNIKENWSVLQYKGETTDGCFGLTKDKYYYWPCSIEHPYYEGVIDDEEFTSYLYSTEPSLWLVVEDPLGMAKRTLRKIF